MSLSPSPELSDLHAALNGWTLPRWRQLPKVDLYMDQVLLLMEKYLRSATGERVVTSAMINNYVKMGALPPPERKKYNKRHLSRLIVICSLKNVLPIASVSGLIELELQQKSEVEFYDSFCDAFEEACRDAAARIPLKDKGGLLLKSALRCQAEQFFCTLALQQLASPAKTEKAGPTAEKQAP